MLNEKWSARHLTDCVQHILNQVSARASDRGRDIVDESSIALLVLWSLLLWERKVGRIALEHIGVDPFELARGLDELLTEKEAQLATTDYHRDIDALLEPLLQQAEHEAMSLGHQYVGSEHLVLAIVGNADSRLLALLQQYRVDHCRLKEAVLKVLTV